MNKDKIKTEIEIGPVKLSNPVLTASGTCGYADELADFMDMSRLGGFITKSITAEPRSGNAPPRIVETDAGMLNAIGLANIGLERFIAEKMEIVAQLGCPVFVNVAGWAIADYVQVTEKLAEYDAISGFELNISCPNVKKGGITFGTDPALIEDITSKVKKVTNSKPLIVKLTPTVTDITVTARAAVNAGADALSMVNTFTAMAVDVETQTPVLANRTGGLSGPAIRPIAVYLVNRVYESLKDSSPVPIIAGGGIKNAFDALEFIIAGASAVTIGTSSFIKPDTAIEVMDGIEAYCRRKDVSDLKSLTGCLK